MQTGSRIEDKVVKYDKRIKTRTRKSRGKNDKVIAVSREGNEEGVMTEASYA